MSSFYRCEKEYPPDPCKHAKDSYSIPREEAIPSMDDVNVLLCPGKTESGKDCRCRLLPIPSPSPFPWKKILLIVIAVGLLFALFIFFFTKNPANPDHNADRPSGPSGTTSIPLSGTVTPPPEPSDAWWVYQQLETTSKILQPVP